MWTSTAAPGPALNLLALDIAWMDIEMRPAIVSASSYPCFGCTGAGPCSVLAAGVEIPQPGRKI